MPSRMGYQSVAERIDWEISRNMLIDPLLHGDNRENSGHSKPYRVVDSTVPE